MPPSDPTSRTRLRSQKDVQRRGMLIAAGVGAAFVGIVGWYAVSGFRRAPRAGRQDVPHTAPRPSALTDDPLSGPQVGSAEAIHVDLMDKKDRRRQAGELIFASMDPLEARHYAVARPQAFLFLNDGRTLHIRADSGNLYMPDRNKEPESGTLTGNVIADLYPARPDGARIDPKVDKPVGTLTTPSMRFDATLGELSMPEQVVIRSQQIDFLGSGVKLVFNQVKQRLELLKIDRGDRMVFRQVDQKPARPPQAAAPGPAPTPVPPAPGSPPTAPTGAQAAASPPLETLYRIDFLQDVALNQGTRRLDSEQLQVWARLIDNSLPPGAIAAVRTANLAHEPKPAGTPARTPAPAPAIAATPSAPPALPADDRELTLRWVGPCEIVPLESVPAELEHDDLSLRFASPAAGIVRLSDAERKAQGQAANIEYRASSGKLTLAGTAAAPTFLDVPGSGRMHGTRIEADLVHGLVTIPGAGRLSRDDGRKFSLEWSDQADFVIATRDGALLDALRQATFAGDVRASELGGSARSGFARADFVSTPRQPSMLSRLILEGGVTLESARSGTLAAEKVDVTFRPGPGGVDPEPRSVTATGNASVEKDGSRLAAQMLEATLAINAKGDSDVTSAHALGGVEFTGKRDNVSASADEMRADFGWDALTGPDAAAGRRQIVDLTGKAVTIARGEQTRINGSQIRLNGVSQAIEVFGAGDFAHNEPGKVVATARWTGGMSFDDSTGKLECFGNASAVSTPDPLSRDTIDAERINLSMTPGGASSSESPAKAGDERAVLSAEATGSVLEREGGVTAKVTSEKFAADSAASEGRRRVQLQYLEGAKILADNTKGTLDVPGAGKMVLVDRRPEGSAAPGTPSDGDSRGDTLLSWTGSMNMDRGTGFMTLKRDVNLTHRSARDQTITTLDCDLLKVGAAGAQGQTLNDADRPALTSALATGAVFATSGPEAIPGQPRPPRRELVADSVNYDAVKSTLEARAIDGKVTMYDPARAAPISAGGLFWDLASDRVEIIEPGPIIAPR